MKIEYIFKHFKDKDIQKETFTLDKLNKVSRWIMFMQWSKMDIR